MSWCSAGEYSGNSENAKAVINATFYEVSDNSPFLRKDFEFQLTELSHTSPPSTSTASFCGGSTTHHKYSVEFDIPASVDLYTPMTATVNMVDECQTGPAESEVSYTLNMAPAWFTSNDPNARVAIVLQGNMAGTLIVKHKTIKISRTVTK